MNIVAKFRRRSAIRNYAKKLGPQLRKRYGASNTYTSGQIRTTAERIGLPIRYVCYGYAMFLRQDEFEILHRELGETCDYDSMRQDVADQCFSGNSDFSIVEIFEFGGETYSDTDASTISPD